MENDTRKEGKLQPDESLAHGTPYCRRSPHSTKFIKSF